MPGFDTSLTRLLDITVPLVQAPMGDAVGPELAAAVSNAGGLGMVSVGWREPDEARALIREVGSLTDRPFGVNLAANEDQHERVALSLAEGVRIVSLFWGDPAPYVDQVHQADGLVMATVGSAEEATAARHAGVDVIVAQGWEAGGHVWGEVATLPLVPRVVDAVAPVPVIAAGGISDGRGFAAMLTLGAAGVWVGTRFLASDEIAAHPTYQERLLAAAETDTTIGIAYDRGWEDAPARTLSTNTTRVWDEAGQPPWGQRPGEDDAVAVEADGSPILRYHVNSPKPGSAGDVGEMALYAGQGVGLVTHTQPAATIVEEMAEQAWNILASAGNLLRPPPSSA